jgi:hypothetical protein
MKKLVSLITILALGALMYFQTNNEAVSKDLEGGGVVCYSSVNDCYFWGCWTVYRCGSECSSVSADEVADQGQCQ